MRCRPFLLLAAGLATPLIAGCGQSPAPFISVAVYEGPPLVVTTSAHQTESVRCGSPVVLKKPDGYNQPWQVSLALDGQTLTTFAGDVSPIPKQWARVVTTGGGAAAPNLTYAYAFGHQLPATYKDPAISGQPMSCG
jgi:hypothetical protein